ncbi:DUF7662 domain-containing protein [Roseibium litorale]|uniref:DUF7662 domain-containing protein n=1 Tax=Roseibium litorale TaxID=2803841 RepID=A0ABR9CLT7_9HYPH|nr:hypothetical protein [Roseibium litorale]MBD8891811.1 hypothetical protein [Roseibium litorale]
MSKYDPLREHLARLEDVVWAAKLDDVEGVLGTNLPRSAREHRTWWANSGGSLVHQNAWLDAGWRVERADLSRDMVVFRRLRIGGTALAEGSKSAQARDASSQSSEERQLTKLAMGLRQPVTVTLRVEWTTLGEVHKVPCSSEALPGTAGVARILWLRAGSLRCVLVPVEAIQPFYRALRLEINGYPPEGGFPGNLLESIGLSKDTPIEFDFVKPGNAWLLTDGRGRRAALERSGERKLVATLLSQQMKQTGIEVRILNL